METVDISVIIVVGIWLGIWRVDKSRNTINITAASANKEKSLNPSMPGRIIIKTPRKPIIIVTALLHPTFSFKKTTAPRVITNGIDWSTAVAFAKGMFITA